MHRRDHIKFGKYVAKQTYIQEMQRKNLERTLLADAAAELAVNWIGNNISVLPDRLEPAVDQYHRGLFHSADLFRKIEEVKQKIRENPPKDWQVEILLIMTLSAYQSHIALDSTTPMGVPDYDWLWRLLESFNRGGS